MSSRWERSDVLRGDAYDERFSRLARAGHDVHGEASFVMAYEPRTVLDAGCGTGRVAIELHHRGVEVVGIDLDRQMLEVAVEKDPDIEWFRADLARFRLPAPPPAPSAPAVGPDDTSVPDDEAATEALEEVDEARRFDVVVAAGNVMIFLEPGTESDAVYNLADHVAPTGVLISGFQLTAGRYDVARYDHDCAAAGLTLVERYASWSRDPWTIDSGYAVSVHAPAGHAEPVAAVDSVQRATAPTQRNAVDDQSVDT